MDDLQFSGIVPWLQSLIHRYDPRNQNDNDNRKVELVCWLCWNIYHHRNNTKFRNEEPHPSKILHLADSMILRHSQCTNYRVQHNSTLNTTPNDDDYWDWAVGNVSWTKHDKLGIGILPKRNNPFLKFYCETHHKSVGIDNASLLSIRGMLERLEGLCQETHSHLQVRNFIIGITRKETLRLLEGRRQAAADTQIILEDIHHLATNFLCIQFTFCNVNIKDRLKRLLYLRPTGSFLFLNQSVVSALSKKNLFRDEFIDSIYLQKLNSKFFSYLIN